MERITHNNYTDVRHVDREGGGLSCLTSLCLFISEDHCPWCLLRVRIRALGSEHRVYKPVESIGDLHSGHFLIRTGLQLPMRTEVYSAGTGVDPARE